MGFLDDLLFGEGPEFQTRSLSTISPEQREALNQLISQMQGRRPTQYNGRLTTQMSPFEQASLTALEERSRALSAPDPTLEAAGGAVRDLTNFEGQTADASAFFKSNVQDPLLESFQREILPQISRSFGGADFFSSERQATEGLAREDLLQELTAQKSAVELDQFNRARDRSLQAAGLAPGLSDAENRRTQTQIDILDAAGLPREIDEANIGRQYTEFARQREEQQQIDESLRQLTLTPTIENLAMEDPGNAGLVATLLGALAQGAGSAAGQGMFNNLLGRLFPSLFGDEAPATSGQTPADQTTGGTGTTVRDVVTGGAAGAGAAGAGGAGAVTPGGSVVITDAAGNVIPSVIAGSAAAGGAVPAGIATTGGGLAGGIAGQVGAGMVGGTGAAAGGAATGGAAAGAGGAAGGAGGAAGGALTGAQIAGLASIPWLIPTVASGAHDLIHGITEGLGIQQDQTQAQRRQIDPSGTWAYENAKEYGFLPVRQGPYGISMNPVTGQVINGTTQTGLFHHDGREVTYAEINQLYQGAGAPYGPPKR